MAAKLDNVWGIETRDEGKADRETRITDFWGFFALAFPSLAVPGLGVPAGELAGLVLGALAITRLPAQDARPPAWFTLGISSILLWLTGVGLLSAVLNERRLVHMAILVLLAVGLASGRISSASAARGLAVGLLASVATAYVGLGDPGAYEGRLSGWLGDPNGASYYLCTLGLIALAFQTRRTIAVILGLLLATATILTYSRTGLIIVAVSALWLLYGRRLRAAGAVLAVGAMAYGIENIPDKYRLFGPFAERVGSDELRKRIIAAEERKLDAAPWFGNGPGTSFVEVRDQTFFFHSSYYGALNEGGWVLLALVIALVVAVFLALSRSRARGQLRTACLQMALVAAMMMAFTLGEVLLDLPLAVALGVAIRHARLHPRRDPADKDATAQPLRAV